MVDGQYIRDPYPRSSRLTIQVLEGSMFYREAEAHMRIDVYASSLVMWEVMWRTQLDQRDVVPPYFLPFERQIPGNPSPCEMQVDEMWLYLASVES